MRKTAIVTIDAEGRDYGKVFLLREMPASRAEKWATKAFLALAKSGVEIPDDIAKMGLAGIAAIGLKSLAGVSFADAEPLMDEMFACVTIIPDPSKTDVANQTPIHRSLVEDDIEEIATRLTLRKELFALHVNFSLPAAPSSSISGTSAGPGS
jgi:hypothetical protein